MRVRLRHLGLTGAILHTTARSIRRGRRTLCGSGLRRPTGLRRGEPGASARGRNRNDWVVYVGHDQLDRARWKSERDDNGQAATKRTKRTQSAEHQVRDSFTNGMNRSCRAPWTSGDADDAVSPPCRSDTRTSLGSYARTGRASHLSRAGQQRQPIPVSSTAGTGQSGTQVPKEHSPLSNRGATPRPRVAQARTRLRDTATVGCSLGCSHCSPTLELNAPTYHIFRDEGAV